MVFSMRVQYKRINNGFKIIKTTIKDFIGCDDLQIALKILDGRIDVTNLLPSSIDVVEDGTTFIEAPMVFWQIVKKVKNVVNKTESKFKELYNRSVYDNNHIVIRKTND
ncbi:hypothetical protein [Nostoc phage N1]|nr:hypothetical protein [Nostoc phage N1]